MNPRSAARLAWSLFVVAILLNVAATLLFATSGPPAPNGVRTIQATSSISVYVIFGTVFLVYAFVGGLIASRRPENPLGWMFCGIALIASAGNIASASAYHGLQSDPGSLPGASLAALYGDVSWLPAIGFGTFLFLLFPTGHTSTRWERRVFRLAIFAMSIGVFSQLVEQKLYAYPSIRNPIGFPFSMLPLAIVSLFLILASAIASTVLLIVRFRRSKGDEHQQLKWLTFSAAFVVAVNLVTNLQNSPPEFLNILSALAILLIPVSVAIAILKYRLYDIDVVISKTVVFGALAGFITVVYVGIVVGIGALFGSGNKPNVALSIVATAIVAVAFQPVRERVQRFANRLVYGRRATPYEVLAGFSEQVAGTVANEDVLPQTARVLAQGTGAARADVWRRSGGQLVDEAIWPASEEPKTPIPLADGALPAIPDTSIAVPVHHRGDLLGALSLAKPAGESLTPAEEKLLDDLASQAGLVLRNVGLTAELEARLDEISVQAEELRASRQRIIKAQDAERRRLERNIHDGAQQHLVALAVKLRLAKTISAGDPAKARSLLEELQAESTEALDTLRDLARGIYPPLLEEKGIAEALRSQGKKSPLPVRVEADEPFQRFPIDLETAAYFCCLEALQNAAKSAQATEVVIFLADTGGDLAFSVKDDGTGFDPDAVTAGSGLQNMRDRVEALGGTLRIESTPGSGTTVSGSIPSRELEPAT